MMCSLLLSVSAALTMAKEPVTRLVVWSVDGSKTAYALTENPKITFSSDKLFIRTNTIEVSYDLDKTSQFTYEWGDETGITDLRTDKPFTLEDEALVFPSMAANSTVSVYSLNGMLVFKKTVRKNVGYAFSLSNLNAGVYIVNVNGVSTKIIKR